MSRLDTFPQDESLTQYYEDTIRSFAATHISVWFRCHSVAELTVLAEMAERMGAQGAPTLRAIADVRLENEACGGHPMSQAGYAVCVEMNDIRARIEAEWFDGILAVQKQVPPAVPCNAPSSVKALAGHFPFPLSGERTMSNTKVTVANVSTITRLATQIRNPEWLAARTRAEVWTYTKATAQTLARLQQYGLAEDVRLPLEKVTQLCWTIFKIAKARHAVLKAERSEALAGLPLVEGTEQYA